MLKITSLEVENFGPFKGRQRIDFPDEDGVVIVYGENMRGKTSLLNAIRFAFFGKVVGRATKTTAIHKIGNWEKAAQGVYGFKVDLHFSSEGSSYSLTRECKPRVDVPAGDEDYVVEHFLECDGVVFGPDQTEVELGRLLPEQVSRFFLFDGELLQEYEDLLSSDSDMGRQISEAIERILGVPVLTTARTTALMLKEASEKREAKAAQSDQRTQEYGNALADIQTQREVLKKDLTDSQNELEELKQRKAELEEALRRRDRYALLMEKRDGLSRQIDEIMDKHQTKVDGLRSSMTSAWTMLVSPNVELARTRLAEQKRDLEVSVSQQKALDDLAKGNSESCPTCLRAISEGDKVRIESALATGDGSSIKQQETAIEALASKLSALARIGSTSRSDAPKLRWDAVDELNVDLATKNEELSEIKKALEDVDESKLRKEKHEYETSIRQIEVTERAIDECKVKLLEIETNSEKIQKKLDQLAGGTLDRERRLRKLYTSVHELFDEAIGAYRDKLRERVQADATKYLKLLTTEPEYARLRINDNYGLNIVHEDGQEIPVRSAGAEHVVALCLVGALQNNAPLEGPIIIDSPFGRLDAQHTTNIVRALPKMARQVMLLVYEDELPANLARSELKGKLKSEWVLNRVSARHTDLVRRTS